MIKINFLEKNLNRSKSLIITFTNLFIAMIVVLGLITGFSAFKEVSREVYTCLDEKFSLVLYSTTEILNDKSDIKNDKIIQMLNHYKIGDVGFNAILDTTKIDEVKVKFLSNEAEFNEMHLVKAVNGKEDLEQSIQVAKDIAKNVKEAQLAHNDSPIAKQVTLSIGIATDTLQNLSIDDILINADSSVYKSKETGRNKYTHFSEI